jgi:hypothetical protein
LEEAKLIDFEELVEKEFVVVCVEKEDRSRCVHVWIKEEISQQVTCEVSNLIN